MRIVNVAPTTLSMHILYTSWLIQGPPLGKIQNQDSLIATERFGRSVHVDGQQQSINLTIRCRTGRARQAYVYQVRVCIYYQEHVHKCYRRLQMD